LKELFCFAGYVDCEDDYGYDLSGDGSMFIDGAYQVIKWHTFTPNKWGTLVDAHGNDLPPPSYRVDADKGFNFSPSDDAFVCQKKNHFQITVHYGIHGHPKYVRCAEGGQVKPIHSYYLHFQGVKVSCTPMFLLVFHIDQSFRWKALHKPSALSSHNQTAVRNHSIQSGQFSSPS
jgi:hypothetical protein